MLIQCSWVFCLKLLPNFSRNQTGTIRWLQTQLKKPVSSHSCKFVTEFERKRTVFVEDEVEIARYFCQLLQKISSLLNMRLSAPAPSSAQSICQCLPSAEMGVGGAER